MKGIRFILIGIAFLVFGCDKPDPIAVVPIPPVTPTPPVTPPSAIKYYSVSTVAGNGIGDNLNGASITSPINNPIDVVEDGEGNLYVSEYNRIRKISPSGVITTFAGNGNRGYVDTIGSAAEFSPVGGIDIDSKGNVYVADRDNKCIRKVSPSRNVTTFAGSRSRVSGYVDGPSGDARFASLADIATDKMDNLYVCDNFRIRKVSPNGLVSTLAGTGVPGFMDGPGNIAQFQNPQGIAVDLQGNVYVADERNERIRKISPSGLVTTLAGSGFNGYSNGPATRANFASPTGVAVDAEGIVYVNDLSNAVIRKISLDGQVSKFAGTYNQLGFADGPDSTAKFYYPEFLSINKQGNLYVADRGNHRIRKITQR